MLSLQFGKIRKKNEEVMKKKERLCDFCSTRFSNFDFKYIVTHYDSLEEMVRNINPKVSYLHPRCQNSFIYLNKVEYFKIRYSWKGE